MRVAQPILTNDALDEAAGEERPGLMGTNLLGNREENVEVVYGGDPLQSLLQPLWALDSWAFRAVSIPAGVVPSSHSIRSRKK